MSDVERIIKLFNTTLITTKIPRVSNYTNTLNKLVQSPAFHAILNAIQQYAQKSKVSEERATEEIIEVFRQVDKIWDDYIFHEGLEKLKNRLSS